eukprot:jgi/Chlat1/8066/Chrsp73S07527
MQELCILKTVARLANNENKKVCTLAIVALAFNKKVCILATVCGSRLTSNANKGSAASARGCTSCGVVLPTINDLASCYTAT